MTASVRSLAELDLGQDSCVGKAPMNDLCQAIRRRRLVRLTYGGYGRTVEPYIHGSTSAGREVLLCFQVEGGSASSDPSPWRLLHLDRVSELRVLQTAFAPRDESPESREVPVVHCACGRGPQGLVPKRMTDL